MSGRKIDVVEEVLESWGSEVGDYALPYRNHVYRVIHVARELQPCSESELKKLAIAGVFHDLGVWSDQTLDYLEPSAARAREYLERIGRREWVREVELMVLMHHKLTRFDDPELPLVEAFRRADLTDVSMGAIRWGIPKERIHEIRAEYPYHRFHGRLLPLACRLQARRPLRLPRIFKW